jgi:branched-chain amino acid transport system substrate-binding protein
MAWDAQLFLRAALKDALAKASPGTPEFRTALRDRLEQTRELVVTQGVYTLSPMDHNGADRRSQVMVKIESGKWRYVDTK